MTVRLAVRKLAWVSTAPRGITSTAAVEITANGSAGETSAAATAPVASAIEAKGFRPAAAAPPNWYQCATVFLVSSQPATTPSVEASTTIIFGAARSTTRSTSSAVNRQLMGYATMPSRAQAPY